MLALSDRSDDTGRGAGSSLAICIAPSRPRRRFSRRPRARGRSSAREESQLLGSDHRLDPCIHSKSVEDGLQVRLGRPLADAQVLGLSLIHISEPTRLLSISYAVFCLK